MSDDFIMEEEITFLITGLVHHPITDGRNFTQKLINSIKKFYPKSEMLFVTWSHFDNILYENIETIFLEDPGSVKIIWNNRVTDFNIKRIIHSSQIGISRVKTKFCFRIRSDMIFLNDDFIDIANKWIHYNVHSNMKGRIFFLPSHSDIRVRSGILFGMSDWLNFGYTEDIKFMYFSSSSLIDLSNSLPLVNNSQDILSTEQFIVKNFLLNFSSYNGLERLKSIYSYDKGLRDLYLSSMAQFFVVLEASRIGISSLKYPISHYNAKFQKSFPLIGFNEWMTIQSKHYKKIFVLGYIDFLFKTLLGYIFIIYARVKNI